MRIGVDIVEVARLGRALERAPKLERSIFTVGELREASAYQSRRRIEFLAGRLAAKEAVVKALGMGLADGIPLTEIECRRLEEGGADLRMSGSAQAACLGRGLTRYQASISHERGLAVCFVVLA